MNLSDPFLDNDPWAAASVLLSSSNKAPAVKISAAFKRRQRRARLKSLSPPGLGNEHPNARPQHLWQRLATMESLIHDMHWCLLGQWRHDMTFAHADSMEKPCSASKPLFDPNAPEFDPPLEADSFPGVAARKEEEGCCHGPRAESPHV